MGDGEVFWSVCHVPRDLPVQPRRFDHIPHSLAPIGVPVSFLLYVLSPVLYLLCSSDIPDFHPDLLPLYYSEYSMIGLLSVIASQFTHTYLQGAPHLFRI